MLAGWSVGSWRFTLGALRCLVTKLATDMVSAAKSGSGAKLHRSIIVVILLLKDNGHSNMMFAFTMVVYMSRSKGWANLLSNLHCTLQVVRLLHMHEGLQLRWQTIKETKQCFCAINIRTLIIMLREPNNIFSSSSLLGIFGQGLACFIGVVCWLEMPK